MRKTILWALVFVFCLPILVYGASIGGAKTLGQGKFALGVDMDCIFNRDIKFKSASPALEEGFTLGDNELRNTYRIMGRIDYGAVDNIDIYAKLGGSDFESRGKGYLDGLEVGKEEDDGNAAFAWGVGIKGTYPFENNWLVGLDAEVVFHKNDYDAAFTPDPTNNPNDSADTWTGDITITEWQVAPYVAYKMENFTPYVGCKYSDMLLKYDWTDAWDSNTYKYEADKNFGVFVGLDCEIEKNFVLNIEGRFIDETAMSVAARYKF